jgi:hypothetical protein
MRTTPSNGQRTPEDRVSYNLGLYASELDRHLNRTVETNTQNSVN